MEGITLWHGDCLELMKNIPDGSVDLVLTDPPYGTMKGIDDKHDWDVVLPTEDIIKQIESSIDKNPFASVGVMGFDGKMAYTYTVKAGGRY